MQVLVTGANGHLGASTVRALLELGYEVVAFVRESADLRSLEGLDIRYAYGDVLNGDSLKRAAQGCDVIVHTAAAYRLWAKDPAEIRQPALDGTRNILAAASDAGVRRLVYTSSVTAIGTTGNVESLLTADTWNANPETAYSAAKTQSERDCWALAAEHEVETLYLLPGMIFGPLDYRLMPSTRVVLNLANGSLPTFNTGYSIVDVRDVAAIHALAVEGGEPGVRYPIVTARMTLRQLADAIQTLTGKRVRHLGVGRSTGRMLGQLEEFRAQLMGVEPGFTADVMGEYVNSYQFVEGAATYEAFGHTPIGIDITLRDTLAWLAQQGKLNPAVVERLADQDITVSF